MDYCWGVGVIYCVRVKTASQVPPLLQPHVQFRPTLGHDVFLLFPFRLLFAKGGDKCANAHFDVHPHLSRDVKVGGGGQHGLCYIIKFQYKNSKCFLPCSDDSTLTFAHSPLFTPLKCFLQFCFEIIMTEHNHRLMWWKEMTQKCQVTDAETRL